MPAYHQMTHHEAEVLARRNFFIHLGIYVAVNAGLAILNLTNNPDRLWFYWPLMGWGIGILAHAVAVFVTGKATDRVMIRQARRAQRREERHQP